MSRYEIFLSAISRIFFRYEGVLDILIFGHAKSLISNLSAGGKRPHMLALFYSPLRDGLLLYKKSGRIMRPPNEHFF